ncbi:Peptidase S72 domain-containing protein [Meloidogyne graminicola]|uniref:Peptidase S72 domain-containing protein n=1 Tax=Meloidogyne graminicola TaxID=189291 RepID=A0A8S9ZM00_9BILA|nr:Peptidase S72 domain-containing protein [Meloidogyne graminicola]
MFSISSNKQINSATSLLILLLILTKSSLFIIAGGGVHKFPQLNISVGKFFTFEISEGHFIDIERLPKWIKFNNTAKLLYGIPQLENIGLEHIVIHDSLIEVKVYEEEENFCGIDNSIYWLEIMDPRLITKLTIEKQFQTVKNLLSILKSTQLRINDVRIFPRKYLERYRNVKETLYELASNINNYDNNGMVISLNISCGEIDEQASNIISEIAENGLAFQVVEGELNNDRPLIFTTTTNIQSTTSATTRTTRRVHQPINEINKKPILINPIKSFHCSRGILCRLPIDENTFLDPEDGHTSKLNLTVHSIENKNNNFLTVIPGANIIEGVPITGEFGEGSAKEEEEFNFRLEARDKQNAANSASFQVFVSRPPLDGPKPNHRFNMILDVPIERFNKNPEMIRDFVYRLSGILHRFPLPTGTSSFPSFLQTQERIEAATEIYVDRISDNGLGQTLIQWWDNTISRTYCDEKRINSTRERMLHQNHHTGIEKVRHEFAKQMGAQFHVKKITVEPLGKCIAQHMLDSMRVRVYTTTQKNTLAQEEGIGGVFSNWSQTLLVPIILITTILLLITILILLCCAHNRRGKKGATINRRNEYTTKGRPVVFPDEVPHRDESSSADGSLATVTTPMLMEREQPPLDPNKMTMHENPLYRPPPQLQAQLTKNGGTGHLSNGIMNGQQQQQQHEMSPLNGVSPGRQFISQQQKSPPPQMASTFSPPGALRAIDASPTPQRAQQNSSIPSTFQRDNPHQYSVRFHQHSTPVGQRMPPPYMAH